MWQDSEVKWLKTLGFTQHSNGKSPFLMGKSTISMAIFNSYVSHYQRVPWDSSPQAGYRPGICHMRFHQAVRQPSWKTGGFPRKILCKWMQMVSNGGFSTSIIYNYLSLLEDIEVTITKRYVRSIFSCTAANLLMWSCQFKDNNNRKFVILHASFLSNHFWFDSFEIISQ